MLSKNLLISFLLILGSTFVFGQNKLAIEHKEKNRKRIFKTGSTFQFTSTSDSIYYRGKILDISEQGVTLIRVENEPKDTVIVALNEFLTIRKPTRLQYAGYALGSLVMLSGAYMVLEGPDIANNHWQSRGLGVLTFATGIVPFLINPKKYSIGKTHQLSIIYSEKDSNP
jgi:hypothetical protein